MSRRQSQDYRIRLFRRSDRPAVRQICVACCWMGDYVRQRIPDDWIWAEYWTRYFTDREPEHVWMVERAGDGAVVGYLTGTADRARADRYAPLLLPGIVRRVVRKRLLRNPASRAAMFGMAKSILRGEMALPARVVRQYPATFHFNLLAEARGRGIGTRLFEAFVGRMRAVGVRGVHIQVLGCNPAVPAFAARRGFRQVCSRPLHAWAHLDGGPVGLQTWVLELCPSRMDHGD